MISKLWLDLSNEFFSTPIQAPILMTTKSINSYPKIKVETSDEIQTSEIYGNRTVLFDDMLLSEQESNINLFFTRARNNKIDKYYIS